MVDARRLAGAAIAVALTLGAMPVTAAPAAPERPVVIGVAVSLTGSLANEGQLTKEGYDFWARYVNAHGGIRIGGHAHPVELHYVDDESNPQLTAKRIDALAAEAPLDALLGPYGSAPTSAAATVAEKRGIPMVDSAGAAERIFNQGYRYTFGVLSPARKYLVGAIEYAVKRRPAPKTIAIVAADDSFSLEVQQGAVQSANDHGLRVVYAEHYGAEANAVAATAAGIKAAKPDVVLCAGHLKDSLALHRAMRDQRVDAKMFAYSVGPDTPEFRVSLGSDAQAVVGSAQWSPAVTYAAAPGFYPSARAYADAFAREVGHVPDYHNAEASAAGLALQYALQRAGSLDHEAVRSALAHLDVVTFFGLIKFDERGINVFKPMVVNQIQGERLVTIYPYRLADARAIFPAPAWTH